MLIDALGENAVSFHLEFVGIPAENVPSRMGYKLMYHAAVYMLSAIKRDTGLSADQWQGLCADLMAAANRMSTMPEVTGPEPGIPGYN